MATRSKHLYMSYDNWDFLVLEKETVKKWHNKQLVSDANITPPATPNLDLIYPSKNYRTRFLFYDADKQLLIGKMKFTNAMTKPIKLDGNIIGFVGLRPIDDILQNHTLKFVKQQGEAFLLISAFMLTIAALITWWLAKQLSKPICDMSRATRCLTSGDYTTRIQSNRSDELGQLAFDLNHLASTLENTRQARKRWVADTAHELRTPLAILRGEIEAMQDGIIKITPESLDSLLNETVHLGRLINDLNQLSMHDTGNMDYKMEDIDLIHILENTVASMQRSFDDAKLTLTLNTERKKTMPITADSNRLSQVFSNLMNNSLKYTHSQGELAIHIYNTEKSIVITFEDSAPGIDEKDIAKIFDRFFRVESSRNREKGGRGLGLSICRSIIDGHRGEISAYNSPTAGVGIKIELPKI